MLLCLGKIVFMVEIDNKIVPMVIKDKDRVNKHSLLTVLLENDKYNLSEGYAFYGGNLERCDNITYLPIYMSMFIKDTQSNYNAQPLDLAI